MENETIYFDEEVKGHKLLLTSRMISFKGKQLKTPDVHTLSVSEYRQSINAIPSNASFSLSLSDPRETITINCARVGGLLWLGAGQFRRLKHAALSSVGQRLFSEALKRLASGERLVFENGGFSLEKKIVFTLSREGIEIDQTRTIFSRNPFLIRWEHLRVSSSRGTMHLECYSTGKGAKVAIWRMPNNIVFGNLIDFLMDKANYRVFGPG